MVLLVIYTSQVLIICFNNKGDHNNQSVRVAAPTGRAAHNVGGVTLHRLLGIPGKKKAFVPDLTGIPLQNLQVNLHKMKYLIIDEISMVGAKFFHLIDRRLRQAYGKPSTTFGGCNLILVGDPKQLPPVCDTEIYEKRTRNTGEKALLGMAAFDEIERVIVLTQMMRQNDPKQEQFRNLLNRLRVGESTKYDYNLLKTRFFSTVSNNERNELEEATRLYPTRRQVREHNLEQFSVYM